MYLVAVLSNPQDAAFNFFAERAIAETNSYGPVASSLFQMEGWMAWVGLQQLIVFASERLNIRGKTVEEVPEIRAGEMLQISRLLPAQ